MPDLVDSVWHGLRHAPLKHKLLVWLCVAAYIALQLCYPESRIIMPGPEGLFVAFLLFATSFWIAYDVVRRCVSFMDTLIDK